MLAEVGQRFSDWLANQGNIKAEDKGLYAYGAEVGLASILNFVTTLAIGFAFGMTWEVVVFLVTYVPLRSYAGGYHASTHLRCGLLFAVMVAAVLGFMSYIPVTWHRGVAIFGTLVSAMVIAWLAPVEDENKPLDGQERDVFANQAYIVLTWELIVLMILLFVYFERTACMMALALMSIACIVMLGAAKNRYIKSKKTAK